MRENAEVSIEQPTASGLNKDAERAVSSRSKWGDAKWCLDIPTPGRSRSNNRINWAQKLPDGTLLTDERNAPLLDTSRQFVWSLHDDPPAGKKRLDLATITVIARCVFALIRWMLSNGYKRFSQLDEDAVGRFVVHCRNRPGRKGKSLSVRSLHRYLVTIDLLYAQRNKLPDAIKMHPFGGQLASEVAGDISEGRGGIPRIPDEIAVDIIHKAIIWVDEFAQEILAAYELRREAHEEALKRGYHRSYVPEFAQRALDGFTPSASFAASLNGRNLFTNYNGLVQALGFLVTACFICIAGLVGMRVSEILSLEEGCLQIEHSKDGSTESVYLCGMTYKVEPEPEGKASRWVAPPVIKTVIALLEKLSRSAREKSGLPNLFLTRMDGRGASATDLLETQRINLRINQFADFVGVPLYNGEVWRFSSHQFRKTFARFVGKQDKTGLHALSQHLKHVSQAMTDSYMGKDFELTELIEEARAEEIVQALDSILAADSLAGKMGEEILTRNHRFRGRAGEELRKDYVDFIISEADLTIVSHEHAMCVVQLETALCGGERAKMGRDLCVHCPNFVVSEIHRPFWEEHRDSNQAILERLKDHPPLIQGPVRAEIEQAESILSQLNRSKESTATKPAQ